MSNIVKLTDDAKILFIGITKMRPILYLHRVRHDKPFVYDNWDNVKIDVLERCDGTRHEARLKQLEFEKELNPMFINKSKSGLKAPRVKGGSKGRPKKSDLPHWQRAEQQAYINCGCFSRVRKYQYSRHVKSAKHKRYEESLTEVK